MGDDRDFQSLEDFLKRVPGIRVPIGKGRGDDGGWWLKFAIDTQHRLAWHIVQELGHVLNYLSISERLPTRAPADSVHASITAALSQRRTQGIPVVGHRMR
jgi:hypothetical protein